MGHSKSTNATEQYLKVWFENAHCFERDWQQWRHDHFWEVNESIKEISSRPIDTVREWLRSRGWVEPPDATDMWISDEYKRCLESYKELGLMPPYYHMFPIESIRDAIGLELWSIEYEQFREARNSSAK